METVTIICFITGLLFHTHLYLDRTFIIPLPVNFWTDISASFLTKPYHLSQYIAVFPSRSISLPSFACIWRSIIVHLALLPTSNVDIIHGGMDSDFCVDVR